MIGDMTKLEKCVIEDRGNDENSAVFESLLEGRCRIDVITCFSSLSTEYINNKRTATVKSTSLIIIIRKKYK